MPPLTTRDFDGVATPADVQLYVVQKLLGGSPFARSLDPLPTGSGRVSWPTAGPTGGGWTAEGAPLPAVDINPGSYSVVAKKLAGIFEITSELRDDASFNLAAALGQAIADRLGVQLDDGLIRGGGDPEDMPGGRVGLRPRRPGQRSVAGHLERHRGARRRRRHAHPCRPAPVYLGGRGGKNR